MNQLSGLEKEYKERHMGDERLLEPRPPSGTYEGDKVFIKFGNGWCWWLLDRGYCPEEAKSMGHCGNQGMVTGDRILSLREPRDRGGKTYWEPYLTFILDQKSMMLGEMKGRGNEKPAPRYHPYIITLLRDERIKGIRGGGYLPSHNFSMSDLPEEERAKLEKAKPQLMTLERYITKKYEAGTSYRNIEPDKFVLGKVMALLGLSAEIYDASRRGFIIYKWKDLPEFVAERGGRTAKWIMDVEQGNESLDISEHGSGKDEMRNLLDDLPPQVIHNIGLVLEYEYLDELKDFVEDQGGDKEFEWEPDLVGDVKDFLAYLEDDQGINTEVGSALDEAHLYGTEAGTQDEMQKALVSAVEDATDSGDRVTIAHEGNGWWDGEVFAVLKLADAIEAAVEFEGGKSDFDPDSFVEEIVTDVKVEVSEDHNFNGFDEKAAIERMTEKYGKPPKHVKKPVENQPELFPDMYEAPAKG